MADLSLSGLGSNLDVSTIVSQLMTVERRPLDLLASQAQKTQTRLSAFAQLKSLLATFQGAMRSISPDRFAAVKATVGDTSLASVTAGKGAAEGAHSLEVRTLAEAQKLKSDPFATSGDVVGTGKITIELGKWDGAQFTASRTAGTVTIAAGQATLAGVRDAINAAGIGVSASIVNDGGGPRLVVASGSTGTQSTLRIGVDDDDGSDTDAAGLSRLAYDPAAAAGAGRNLAVTANAADATFVLDGMLITSGSNAVSDALDGATITLAKAAPGTTTTVTLARDTGAAQAAVDTFVKAWNDVRGTLATLTAYDATRKTAGTLQGDSLTLSIESRLRRVLTSPMGEGATYGTLAQVGVTLQKDGTLKLDATKLSAALAKAPDAVAALFGAVATASDTRVTVSGFSADTQAGTHAVTLAQAATQASLAGSDPAALDIQDGVNDSLAIVVDGVAATVKVKAQVYASAAALAQQLEATLNAAPAYANAGITVKVSATGGALTVQSQRYGAASSVANATGTAAAALFGATPQVVSGLDAGGTIAGVAATGSGRTLSATSGAASGLKVLLAASAPGAYGDVRMTRGIADLLAAAAGSFLQDDTGIDGRVDGLNAALKLNQKRQDEFNLRLKDTEARLKAQFTALDTLMSRMNQTSAYLTQQLANLPKIGS